MIAIRRSKQKHANSSGYKTTILRQVVNISIVSLVILCGGCHTPAEKELSASVAQGSSGKNTSKLASGCAANSLYALCSRANLKLSHQQCMKLLPARREGNNMLEYKMALDSLGFRVQAQWLSASEFNTLDIPAILLVPCLGKTQPNGFEGSIGHYLVLWPLDNEAVEILDRPCNRPILTRRYWVKHLQRTGLEQILALLCLSVPQN